MSLLKKNITRFASSSLWSYLLNDTRFTYARYHTCLNNEINIQSKFLEQNKTVQRNSSILQTMREAKYFMIEKTKEIASSAKFLVPTYGFQNKYIGFLWYKSLDKINIQDFFTIFKLSDTFYSRFKVIELHVWMLLYHLPKSSRKFSYVRWGLIQAMWQDNEERAKLLDKYNVNFKKNFRNLNAKFRISLMLYDDGFYKNDVALSSAVWCNFFDKKEVDPLLIEALVSYIRYQMHNLNQINLELVNINEKEEEIVEIWAPLRPHVEQLLLK